MNKSYDIENEEKEKLNHSRSELDRLIDDVLSPNKVEITDDDSNIGNLSIKKP